MDLYDQQAEEIKNNPNLIYESWRKGEGMFKTVTNLATVYHGDFMAGCLTQIRDSSFRLAIVKGKPDMVLTDEIRKDTRIPRKATDITAKHFPAFVEWQRKIDAMQMVE